MSEIRSSRFTLTHEERGRLAWKRICWRLGLPDMDWKKNEEAATIIALEIAQACEAAKRDEVGVKV